MGVSKGKSRRERGRVPAEDRVARYLAAAGLLIALFSTVMAAWSLSLERRQFDGETKPTWTAEVRETSETVVIDPSQGDMRLGWGRVVFPSDLGEPTRDVAGPDYSFATTTLRTAVASELASTMPELPDKLQLLKSYVPVVLESNYSALGQMESRSALYYLQFTATRGDRLTVVFTSFDFVGDAPDGVDASDFVDDFYGSARPVSTQGAEVMEQ